MENNDLCALTSLAAQAQPCFAVLFFSVLFGRTRHDASILPHLVQDRGLCIRLSITIHYKIFPIFKRMLVMLLCEKIILPPLLFMDSHAIT